LSQAGSLEHCELCPRRCGVNRRAGQKGYCRAGATVELFRHGPHFGEEPPLTGTRGSGTLFFSRCTLRCLYCQNHPWSQQGQGAATSVDELAGILRGLAAQGCHNWNLVSPTPWLPLVREAIARARATELGLPVVMNTSGYERVETLESLADLVRIYLPDLRYASAESARIGSDAPDYPAVARAALLEMWRQTGPLRLDEDDVAISGTICRLLILPGRAGEVIENLRWLADHIGPEIPVSVMAQYLPAHRAPATPGWDRGVTREEYDAVSAEVERLGFELGWVQEYGTPTAPELVGYQMPAGGGTAE